MEYVFRPSVCWCRCGKGKEERIEATGDVVASHSEVSRLLAEHGMLGVLSLLILGITFSTLFENKFNLYLLSFMFFGH
jgi:hypothetical protein